jgi:hypothetical protein
MGTRERDHVTRHESACKGTVNSPTLHATGKTQECTGNWRPEPDGEEIVACNPVAMSDLVRQEPSSVIAEDSVNLPRTLKPLVIVGDIDHVSWFTGVLYFDP